MKYSKTTTEKSDLTLNSFPHRYFKKQLPKISEKVVPTHYLEIRQLYQGRMDELLLPEQWAYVPNKTHKRSQNHRSHTEGAQRKFTNSTYSSQKFRSTSEVFLKKYLKRKQQKQVKQSANITNYAGLPSPRRQGVIKLKTSKPEKYKSESRVAERERARGQHANVSQNKLRVSQDIDEFKSEKLELKEKLKIYETNIKNKRFEIKIGDRRYKHIQHTFETVKH